MEGDEFYEQSILPNLESRKLRDQIHQLQIELEEKDCEIDRVKSTVKESERKWKKKMSSLNDDLEEKQYEIDNLNKALKKLKKMKNSSRESSLDNGNEELLEKQKKLDALLEEMNRKDQQISDMESELEIIRRSLDKERREHDAELQNHQRMVYERDDTIESNGSKMEALQKQIEEQENELIRFREQKEEFQRRRKSTDGSKVEAEHLIVILKDKDEKIANLKEKINVLKSKQQVRESPISNKKVKFLLQEISERSGQKVDDIDDAIGLVENVFQNCKPKEWSELRSSFGRGGGDRARMLFQENSELESRLQDKEFQLQSAMKKHKKDLLRKDKAIEDLQEELEEQKQKSLNDYKTKTQLTQLNDKVRDLESRLEQKDADIEKANKKYNDADQMLGETKRQINEFYDQIAEFQTANVALRREKNDLEKKMKQKEEFDHEIDLERTTEMQNKQKAIENMREKVNEYREKAEHYERQLTQKIVELDYLQEQNRKLEIENNQFRIKINNQEKEITLLKVNSLGAPKERGGYPNVGAPDNRKWYPVWWSSHME